MSRSDDRRAARAQMAQQTVAILEAGNYEAASRERVDLAQPLRACLDATRYLTPEEASALRETVLAMKSPDVRTRIDVANETTLAGLSRLLDEGGSSVAVLNFASANNPGGGFMSGSQAQEESLARASALTMSQRRAFAFYETHRAMASKLYSDAMILSPACPVFRDDAGSLLASPRFATFITCAAPNAIATVDHFPLEVMQIPDIFRRRIGNILALALHAGCRHLILGAWGCGVFGNDPELVARSFHRNLITGDFAGRFERITFSVLDKSTTRENISPFERVFGQTRPEDG